jgi:hypothetical protein
MEYIEVVGLEVFYDKKYTNPSWIKMHENMLMSFQFSKMQRGQISAFYSLVFLAIRTRNRINRDPRWINSRTFCKVGKRDIELFQALRLIKIVNAAGNTDTQNRSRIEVEENRIEVERIEENITSFFSSQETPEEGKNKKQKPTKNFPVNESVVKSNSEFSEDCKMSKSEFDKIKAKLGVNVDIGKFSALVKDV